MLQFWFILWLSVSLAYFILDICLVYNVLQIKSKYKSLKTEGISVIIAAKNEADNLSQNLTGILQQKHSKFEVIVVNDNSTDNTIGILEAYKEQYSNLRYITIKSDEPSKKIALTKGIEISRFDTLCFTDADCRPQSWYWLSTMENYMTESSPVVLGFSPYSKYKGLLNKLIRFETLQTAINYFGYAKMGMPYMAVGRNLMYKKDVFQSVNGFKKHEHIKSGDDDLFLNEVISKYDVALCLDPKSFVESTPKTSLKSWINQKRRHITTADHYNTKHQLVLSSQFVVRFLFWYVVLPFCGFLPISDFWVIIGFVTIFTMLIVLKTEISRKAFSKLNSQSLFYSSPILEFMLLNLQLYLFLSNLRHPKKDW